MLSIHLTIHNFSQCICNISGVKGMTTVYPRSRKCMQYTTFQHRTLSVRSPRSGKWCIPACPTWKSVFCMLLTVRWWGASPPMKIIHSLLCSTITSIWGNSNLFIKHSQINYTNNDCSLTKKKYLFLQLSQFDGYRVTSGTLIKTYFRVEKTVCFSLL